VLNLEGPITNYQGKVSEDVLWQRNTSHLENRTIAYDVEVCHSLLKYRMWANLHIEYKLKGWDPSVGGSGSAHSSRWFGCHSNLCGDRHEQNLCFHLIKLNWYSWIFYGGHYAKTC
jgi:hypothetical protein